MCSGLVTISTKMCLYNIFGYEVYVCEFVINFKIELNSMNVIGCIICT